MRGRMIEGTIRTGATGSKVKQCRGTTATDAIVLSLAKKIRSFSIVGTDRACSNGRDWKNKCSYDTS